MKEPGVGQPAIRGQQGAKSQQATTGQADSENAKLPLRDWFFIPALALLTIGFLIAIVDLTAKHLYSESKTTTLSCLILNDPTTGVRAIPNSVCYQKSIESEPAEYRFNSCGHRAGMECGPKSPGAYRIVMVGSSYNYGMYVPREKSFAALLPQQLSQITGRNVQLYNESMQWGFPPSTVLRFHQVFDAQPDMILWVLTPYDISKAFETLPYAPPPPGSGAPALGAAARVKIAFRTHSIPDAIGIVWDRGVVAPWDANLALFRWQSAGILLQHLVYSSKSIYLKSYLMQPDEDGGYLHAQLSPLWQKDLAQFDRQAAEVEAQAKAAGIPFVSLMVPERAQAAMLSSQEWTPGYDPFTLDHDVRDIIVRHGGTFIDVLPEFEKIPNPENDFMSVDGHPYASGHALISNILAQALTSGPVPALKALSTESQAHPLSGQSR